MASAVTSHSRKIAISNRPNPMMGPIDGERTIACRCRPGCPNKI